MPTISANVGTNERKVLTLKTKDKYCTENITINVDGPIVSSKELFLEDRIVTLSTPGETFYGGDSVLSFKESGAYTSSYFTSTTLIWQAKTSLNVNVVAKAYKTYQPPSGPSQWIADKDLTTAVTLAAGTIFRTVSFGLTTSPGYQTNNGVVTWKYETWDSTNNVWVSHTATRGSIYSYTPSTGVTKSNSATVVTGTFEREDNTALRSIKVNVNNASYSASLATTYTYPSGDIQHYGSYGYVTVSNPTVTVKTSSAGWLAAGNTDKTASGSMKVYVKNDTIVKYAKQYITPETSLASSLSSYRSITNVRELSLTKNQCFICDWVAGVSQLIYFSDSAGIDESSSYSYDTYEALPYGNQLWMIYFDSWQERWVMSVKKTDEQDFTQKVIYLSSDTLYFKVSSGSTPVNYVIFTTKFSATI